MMAIAEPPERQLAWAEKAMALAEKTKDERAKKWLGPLYNNTGWTYHDLEPDGYVYEEARPYFDLAYQHLSSDPWLAENEAARAMSHEYVSPGHTDRSPFPAGMPPGSGWGGPSNLSPWQSAS